MHKSMLTLRTVSRERGILGLANIRSTVHTRRGVSSYRLELP